MPRKTLWLSGVVALCAMLLAATVQAEGDRTQSRETGKDAVLSRIERYRDSIVHADQPELAAQVWSLTPEATFIHPRGHERGWEAIKKNFYGKTMGKTFFKRDLNVVGTPTVFIHGDTAVAEFNWDFVATVREDGSRKHTRGRESQVYVNVPGQGWRLTHVHYSGPATTAKGQGF